jgi:hypothetical protein
MYARLKNQLLTIVFLKIPIESMNRTMSPIESNTGQQNLSNNRHTNLSNRNTFHNGTVDLQPVSAASRNSRYVHRSFSSQDFIRFSFMHI